MVAIPTHAAAHVEQQARNKKQHRRNLVGQCLGRVEVPGIKADRFLPRDGVSEVKLVRTRSVALRADAEELGLDGVNFLSGGEWLGEDGVERLDEPLPGSGAVHGQVFVAIGDPNIGHAGRSECASDIGPDLPAAASVFDPELAHACIAMREGEAVRRLRVGEEGGVEIHSDPEAFRPVDPALEVTGFHGVAVHVGTAVFEVECVEVEPVLSRHEGEDLLEVGPQFIGSVGASGVVTCHRESASR